MRVRISKVSKGDLVSQRMGQEKGVGKIKQHDSVHKGNQKIKKGKQNGNAKGVSVNNVLNTKN